jgi:hypothetical protein
MPTSVKELPAGGNAVVPRLKPAGVRDMIGKSDVLVAGPFVGLQGSAPVVVGSGDGSRLEHNR